VEDEITAWGDEGQLRLRIVLLKVFGLAEVVSELEALTLTGPKSWMD
jgi:hypothetical protein